ncbi:MAG: 30S ribosomal protein S13 [Candidatus Micrarchaeia archaeon]
MADEKIKAKPKGKPLQEKSLPKAAQKKHSENYRGIVRIIGRDLQGFWSLERALSKIKGVGQNLAKNLILAIEKELKIPRKTDVGELSDEQIDAIEKIVKSPQEHGVKNYNLNRGKDRFDGKNKHLLTSDLSFAIRQDIKKEGEMRSWRGWRHQLGMRVRGQRTRTTGRSGISVGVMKKALKQQKTAGGKSEGAEKKK